MAPHDSESESDPSEGREAVTIRGVRERSKRVTGATSCDCSWLSEVPTVAEACGPRAARGSTALTIMASGRRKFEERGAEEQALASVAAWWCRRMSRRVVDSDEDDEARLDDAGTRSRRRVAKEGVPGCVIVRNGPRRGSGPAGAEQGGFLRAGPGAIRTPDLRFQRLLRDDERRGQSASFRVLPGLLVVLSRAAHPEYGGNRAIPERWLDHHALGGNSMAGAD